MRRRTGLRIIVVLLTISLGGGLLTACGPLANGLVALLMASYAKYKQKSGWAASGDAKLNQKDYDGAIADYTKAIGLNPKDDSSYSNRGAARYHNGDYEGAIADYTKVIELNPNSNNNCGCAYIGRGRARDAQDDYAGAIADFTKAIELNPKSDGAWNNRAWTEYRQQTLTPALLDVNQALLLNPQNGYAHSTRGWIKFAQGDSAGAVFDLEQAVTLTAVPDFFDQGLLNYIYDVDDKAVGAWEQAIQMDPMYKTDLNPWIKKAQAHIHERRPGDFVTLSERAMLSAPANSLVAWYRLDETNGTTVTDASGQNNTATNVGATITAGKLGNGLAFDGKSYVSATDSASRLILTKMTLMAWIKPAQSGTAWAILRKGPNGALNYRLWLDPANRLWFGFDVSFAFASLRSAVPVPADGTTWTHVAATYDGVVMVIYINGQEQGRGTFIGLPTSTHNQELYIGRDVVQNLWYQGELDEVKIYNMALGAAEIQAAANGAAAPASTTKR